MTGVAGQDVTVVLTTLRQRLDLDRLTNIGFPSALDFDYTELAPFFGYVLNNIGDPYVDGVAGRHTKELERDVVEYFADLFHAPPDDRWGYVTTGGTEGNASGLHLARTLHPDAKRDRAIKIQARRYRIPAGARGAPGQVSRDACQDRPCRLPESPPDSRP